MLHFLQPAGLLALSALALPALLHLWRKPSQTVRLGSLRFLQNVPQRRLRDLRWHERLLLMVRLLLLALLALWLAQPRWQPAPSTVPQRWALLDPNAVLGGSALDQWRSLTAAGYEMRQMVPGFPAISSGESPAGPLQPEDVMSQPNLWSLLREADSRLPAGSRLAVFSPGRLSNLHGDRPAMQHSKVDWILTDDRLAHQTRIWLKSLEQLSLSASNRQRARAHLTVSNASSTHSIRMLVEEEDSRIPVSGEPGWEMESTKQPDGAFAARLIHRDGDAQMVGPWVSASQEKATKVIIGFDSTRSEDARYVKAAATAARDTEEDYPAEIVSADVHEMMETLLSAKAADAELGTPQELVFWLSDEPIPTAISQKLAERGANIVYDASHASAASNTALSSLFAVSSDSPSATTFTSPIRLWRRTPAQAIAGAVTLWQDGFGQPLLTYAPKENGGGEWHFQSRFRPDWNDLPRTGALPAWIHQLLFGAMVSPMNPAHDLRLADPQQNKPEQTLTAPSAATAPPLFAPRQGTDLQPILWGLAVVAFALERMLSHRRATATASAAPRQHFSVQPQEAGRP